MKANQKTTIAAAEKRVIKAEIAGLKKAAKKVSSDHKSERAKLFAEQRRIERDFMRLNRTENRELSAITRRLGILQGRL